MSDEVNQGEKPAFEDDVDMVSAQSAEPPSRLN